MKKILISIIICNLIIILIITMHVLGQREMHEKAYKATIMGASDFLEYYSRDKDNENLYYVAAAAVYRAELNFQLISKNNEQKVALNRISNMMLHNPDAGKRNAEEIMNALKIIIEDIHDNNAYSTLYIISQR